MRPQKSDVSDHSLPGGCPCRSCGGKSFVPHVALAQQGCDHWMSQSNSVQGIPRQYAVYAVELSWMQLGEITWEIANAISRG